LSDINTESQALLEAPDEEGLSLLENARRIYQATTDNIKINARIQAFRQAAENISEHTINLIVVFVLQTLLIPLIYLWGALQLLKYLIINPVPSPATEQ